LWNDTCLRFVLGSVLRYVTKVKDRSDWAMTWGKKGITDANLGSFFKCTKTGLVPFVSMYTCQEQDCMSSGTRGDKPKINVVRPEQN